MSALIYLNIFNLKTISGKISYTEVPGQDIPFEGSHESYEVGFYGWMQIFIFYIPLPSPGGGGQN